VKNRLRVGLVWSGSKEHRKDSSRSIELKSLFQYLPQGAEYICLQKEISEQDKNFIKSSTNINFVGDKIFDFCDTAALCKVMDLIISVDTSVCHLAGSLGKQTWLMLPFSPDWRWMLNSDFSPWYTSLRLYRQTTIGDWNYVFKTIQSDLDLLISKRKEKFLTSEINAIENIVNNKKSFRCEKIILSLSQKANYQKSILSEVKRF